MGCVFVAGLVVSSVALATLLAGVREQGTAGWVAALVALAVAYFAAGLCLWLLPGPWRRPRLVPCFETELGSWNGPTFAAFRRGHDLYRQIDALDVLALELGVIPLSAFGFNDDLYGQEVTLHPASDGARTARALKDGLTAGLSAQAGVAEDLDALVTALEAAAEANGRFSLLLRLGSDSLQAIASMEQRNGRFW